jgi:MauM/NapG family ferredoxin protein
MSDDEKRLARRGFFRRLVIHSLDAAEEVGKQMGKQVLNSLEQANILKPKEPDYSDYNDSYTDQYQYERFLRPPGAMAEWEFTDMCARCGHCVDACPADAIKIDPDKASGAPHIVARNQACVICDDLSCMKVCPSGALTLVESPEKIHMGIAMVDQHTCLRSDWEEDRPAQDCKICIEVCPFGEKAIGLDFHDQIEVREACTGCGLCENRCPTETAAIWVEESYDSMHDHYHDDHDTSYDHNYQPAARLTRAKLRRHKRIRSRHASGGSKRSKGRR